MKFYGVLIALLLVAAGCKSYSDEELDNYDQRIREYIEANNIECEQSATGLYYRIIDEGEGAYVQLKDSVGFTYRGTLLNGEVFDEQKEAVQFKVTDLIAAWKEILLNLREGGSAYLITPPQLAYGTHELDDIPANSILIYELEVKYVK